MKKIIAASVLCSAFAVSSVMAGDFQALGGAMTDTQLAAVEGGSAQTATATGGNGGAGGIGVNVGVNALNCVIAVCGNGAGSQYQSAGNGGNGGGALAFNKRYYW